MDADKSQQVTNATTEHHHILHAHPGAANIRKDSMDAQECPALKGISKKDELVDNVCPVVGPVSGKKITITLHYQPILMSSIQHIYQRTIPQWEMPLPTVCAQ